MVYFDLRGAAGLVPSLSAQVAREVGVRIVGGVYAPGDLIEGEAALSARFKVSRSVIRDALKVLAGKGLLDARRGIGVRVRARDNWSLLDDEVLAWHLSLPPNRALLGQLLEACLVFEPRAARHAARRATAEDVDAIKDALRNLGAIEGVEHYAKADGLFHRAVMRAAHNEFLTAVEGIVYSALLMMVRVFDPRGDGDSLRLHSEVADAIATGKPDKAEKAMVALLINAEKRIGADDSVVGESAGV